MCALCVTVLLQLGSRAHVSIVHLVLMLPPVGMLLFVHSYAFQFPFDLIHFIHIHPPTGGVRDFLTISGYRVEGWDLGSGDFCFSFHLCYVDLNVFVVIHF